MNLNKIFATILAVTLMAGVGVTSAFATNSESTTGNSKALIRSRIEKRVDLELTDEQKEEIEARKAKMNISMEKWGSLSDEQKEEIYALRSQVNSVEGQIIDKYLEWGVIDQETSTHLKERLTNSLSKCREDGKIPMVKGRGFDGGVRFRGIDKTDITADTI